MLMHCNRINNEGYVKVYPLVNSCNGYPQPRKSAGFPGVLLGQGQAILQPTIYRPRRRIYTEEKAKPLSAVSGTECI